MLKITQVHQDNRGEIHIITGDLKECQEITLLSTKKGFARGGCVHRLNDEFCVVLEGKIKHFIGDNKPRILQKGQSIIVPKNTPHYIVSLTDSLIMEWGVTPEEKGEKDKTFREVVDKINGRIHQSN